MKRSISKALDVHIKAITTLGHGFYSVGDNTYQVVHEMLLEDVLHAQIWQRARRLGLGQSHDDIEAMTKTALQKASGDVARALERMAFLRKLDSKNYLIQL